MKKLLILSSFFLLPLGAYASTQSNSSSCSGSLITTALTYTCTGSQNFPEQVELINFERIRTMQFPDVKFPNTQYVYNNDNVPAEFFIGITHPYTITGISLIEKSPIDSISLYCGAVDIPLGTFSAISSGNDLGVWNLATDIHCSDSLNFDPGNTDGYVIGIQYADYDTQASTTYAVYFPNPVTIQGMGTVTVDFTQIDMALAWLCGLGTFFGMIWLLRKNR